jgi:hypothetical protein
MFVGKPIYKNNKRSEQHIIALFAWRFAHYLKIFRCQETLVIYLRITTEKRKFTRWVWQTLYVINHNNLQYWQDK